MPEPIMADGAKFVEIGRPMSKAAEKRESKRQQFIWNTISYAEAMAHELAADPGFLDDRQKTQLSKALKQIQAELGKEGE